jgi:FKBP-type peptidyl-prolyl cis-trans isomerase FklB
MKHRILVCVLCAVLCMLSAVLVTAQTTKAKPKTPAKPVTATNTKGPVLKNALDSFSYAMGLSLGNFCDQQGIKTLNTSMVLKGLGDRTKTGTSATLMTEQQMNQVIAAFLNKRKSATAASARAEGEKFLAENAKKPGVVTTASGLQYTVLKAGKDTTHPTLNDQVKCHYHGTLLNGTVFDSSVERGEPVVFPVNGVIQGWIEALQLMTPGSKWRLFVPADLAYGDQQAGPKIAPGSTLIFDVELLEIVKQ